MVYPWIKNVYIGHNADFLIFSKFNEQFRTCHDTLRLHAKLLNCNESIFMEILGEVIHCYYEAILVS